MPGIICSECRTEVVDNGPGPRLPCPACGSLKRTFNEVIVEAVTASFHVSATVLAGAGLFVPPALLTQAIIVPGDKTAEGILVHSVTEVWTELVTYFVDDPTAIFRLEPRKLEELVAGMYQKMGYEVTLTPQSGDHGVDVIAVKHGFGSVRLIESVKKYKPGHLVTADDVRSLVGALSGDPLASKGLVTTTSDFAPRLLKDKGIASMIPTRLELVNGDELRKRLAKTTG